jgi:GAF domain-containing protein
VAHEGYRAVLSVPILSKGEPEGVLSVYWWEAHLPSSSEVALMSAFAGQAGIALENARLYGETARQAERIRAVAELGRTLVSSLDVNDILETVATRARDTLQVMDIGICLEPPEGGALRFVWGRDSPQSVIQSHLLEPGEGVAGRAVLENRPVWSASILDDPLIELRPETRRRIEETGTRAVLAIPLVRQRPFGALVVHREAGHHFTEPEIDYLSVFASQVAVALDNARLYAALDDRAARLRTLAHLTNMMSSSLDANAVLRAIARAAAEIMRVPFVAVYVADETAGTLELSAASDEGMGDDLPRKKRRIGEGLVGWVAQHRQPLTVPDALTDERAMSPDWARAHGLRGFFGVPILSRTRCSACSSSTTVSPSA